MKDEQQLNELIEKARTDIMAAECTLWNFLGEQLDHDVNQRLGEDRLRFRVINALHDAERILRTISQCREDDKSLIEKKADAAPAITTLTEDLKSMTSKIYKVEIETLRTDIEGKELTSSHTDKWYFDSFDNAVWCADHPGIERDFWTQTKSRIFEYEISNMREIHKKPIAVEFATKIEQHWIRDES